MVQNISTAVMQRRVEAVDSPDFFPTPPWATRALIEHVIMPLYAETPEVARMALRRESAWEPACGAGDMAKVLNEYFSDVLASDLHSYGYGSPRVNFLEEFIFDYDWIITNPPFRLAERFVNHALGFSSTRGVAMLVRTSLLEGIGRYSRLFALTPPTVVAQFVERVPMVKGRLTATGSTATSYCWMVWRRNNGPLLTQTRMMWIPPCRKAMERPGDYPETP